MDDQMVPEVYLDLLADHFRRRYHCANRGIKPALTPVVVKFSPLQLADNPTRTVQPRQTKWDCHKKLKSSQ